MTAKDAKGKEVLVFTYDEGVYEKEPSYLLLMNEAICKIYPKKHYSPTQAQQLAEEYIWEYEKMRIPVVYPKEAVLQLVLRAL